MQITVIAVMCHSIGAFVAQVRQHRTGPRLSRSNRHPERYADAVLHTLAARARRLERAVDLPR